MNHNKILIFGKLVINLLIWRQITSLCQNISTNYIQNEPQHLQTASANQQASPHPDIHLLYPHTNPQYFTAEQYNLKSSFEPAILLYYMKITALIFLIMCLGMAKKHRENYQTIDLALLGINNVTTFNAESSRDIVFGDINGNLSIFNTSVNHIFEVQQAHNSPIAKIQRIELANYSGYLTVDTSAHIVYWNHDMSIIHYKDDNLSSLILGNVTDVVVNQRGHKLKNKHYLLAINTENYVYEYCINNRKVRRNITSPSNNRILSIVYIGKNLFASVQIDGLYVAGENDTQFKFVGKAYGNVDMLTTHQENDFYDDDGLAVLNHTSILHFTTHGFKKRMETFYGGSRITSLNQCQSRQKRQKEDLYVVGFQDGTILVRGGERGLEKHISSTPIQIIECQQDKLLYIDSANTLVAIDLDHLEHTRPKFSGIAAILLAIVVFTIVGCFIKYRRDKRRQMVENRQLNSGLELQERAYQPPN